MYLSMLCEIFVKNFLSTWRTFLELKSVLRVVELRWS
jgi:hypothetical protein